MAAGSSSVHILRIIWTASSNLSNRSLFGKKGIPKERVGEFIIYGTPDDVLKQIELLEEVGIQYLIVDLEPYRELEALEIFADNIIKKMSRTEIDIS